MPKVLTVAIVGVVLLLLLPGLTFGANNYFMVAEELIKHFEGFVDHPYWDNKQYSWGYGTKAPGASGTITPDEAAAELREHMQQDYDYLSQLIFRPLTANQWAALLSFSYNLGAGNADNLVPNINSGDDEALGRQWMLYINAGGVPNDGLEDRRRREWAVWKS